MQSIYKHSLLAVILFSLTGLAHADCWEEAGRQFSIAPELLYAIAEQESNLDPRAIGHNRNGSRDIGLMQVNSMHLPQLAKQRITEQTLLNDSCQALKVGAGILADFMRRYGYSWEAVGAYNAGTATDAAANTSAATISATNTSATNDAGNYDQRYFVAGRIATGENVGAWDACTLRYAH